jgi:signal transduction histidine kinase
MLCHEFNTPLNVILGFSELLMQSIKDPEHTAWAKDINDSGTHLHEILMEIVDYIGASHLAAAGVESEFVARVLLQPLIPNFREKEITVEFVHGPGFDGKLLGPSRSIFMIARKLVRMCSHQAKAVRVTMGLDALDSAGNARLRLVVAPLGLPRDVRPAELDKLFEPYQFAPSGQNGSRTSLGLELATCRKIAEYVHGTVDCAFKSDGRLDFVAEIPVKTVRGA